MNDWKVVTTPEFKEEIRDIYIYIASTLLVPETALAQVGRILDEVEALGVMPMRHSSYAKDPWYSRGLRKLVVDNYIVFYLPNEKTHEVVLFHVFYGGREVDKLL